MQTIRPLAHRSRPALVACAALLALAAAGCLKSSVTLGSDTGGGACAAETPAEPVTLATVQGNATAIAVNGTNVYWATYDGANSGAIWKVPLGGGTPTKLVTTANQQQAVAADATNVYWSGDKGLSKMPQDGGTPTVLAAGGGGSALALDATNVYYTNYDGTGNTIRKVPIEGGTPVVIASFVNPTAIAVDATNVYILNDVTDSTDSTAVDPLEVAPLTGGPLVPVAQGWPWVAPIGGGLTRNLAVGMNSVFWADVGHVGTLPLGGDQTWSVVPDNGEPLGLAMDETSVFWTDVASGEIKRMPLDGCPVSTFVSGELDPGAIAVDATSVYWISGKGIRKAPK
jgi:hypothetical protein